MAAACMHAPTMDEFTGNWLAVHVWAGREQISARHLRLRGYEVFLPCYRERRRWSDRVKTIERALFDGYVFCRADHDVVNRIITAPGVIRIVGNREGPLPVSAHELDAIRRIVDASLQVEPWAMPQVGQRVMVEAGPLSGIEGVVLVVKNSHRLVVSIALLQRAVAVEIESDWVRSSPLSLLSAQADS